MAASAVGVKTGSAASIADFVQAPADAQLIAIGVEGRILCAEHSRLMVNWWRLKVGDHDINRVGDELEVPHARICELSDKAVELQATSPAAWQAKAELLRHFMLVECETDGEMVFNSCEQELAWSLICDMTGSA